MENNNLENEYVEIDLREYLFILFKRKYMIISIIILGIFAVLVLNNFILENQYMSTATIKLGNAGSTIYTSPQEVKKLIKSRSFIETVKQEEKIKINQKLINKLINNDNSILTFNSEEGSRFIDIVLKMPDPQKATNMANSIARVFIKQSSESVISEKELIKDYKNELIKLKDDNVKLKTDLEGLGEKFRNTADKNKFFELDYIQKTLIELKEIVDRQDLNLSNEIYNLNKRLEKIEKPVIMSIAEESEEPFYPNTTLNLAIALVLSLFIGIFLSFFLEFINDFNWNKYKK